MPHHYLAPYVGTGTEDDPFRPKGVDGLKTWTAIDLRADCTQAAGFALLAIETPDPSIGPYLGDDPDTERPGLPGLIRASLGILPEATRLRDILAELLILHGREDGTRHRLMRPSKDGQYTIWLGGQQWGTFRPIRGGSTIVESFNTADSDTLGPDLSWTELIGDADVVSTELSIITRGATSAVARADSDLATDDHYCEAVLSAVALGTSTYNYFGVECRKDSTTTLTNYNYRAVQTTTPLNEHRLQKFVAGSATQLGASDAADVVAGEIVRIEADGSSISGWLNGILSVGPVTDTTISGNLRTGIRGLVNTGTGTARIKPFRAGDLSDIRCLHWASGKTTDFAHSSPIAVTIPATTAGSDLVVMVQNGEDPNALPTVSAVTATGATFTRRGGVQNTSGTDGINVECWVARNVDAGITSVSVAFTAAAVGVACVAEYANVQSLGQIVYATGTGANPTISVTTQDPNNMVVAGFGNEDTGQASFTVASSGMFRTQQYALGDGSPDVPGCLVDNISSTAAAVANTLTYAPTTTIWAAVALELRSVVAGTPITIPRAGAYA